MTKDYSQLTRLIFVSNGWVFAKEDNSKSIGYSFYFRRMDNGSEKELSEYEFLSTLEIYLQNKLLEVVNINKALKQSGKGYNLIKGIKDFQ